MNIYPDSYIEQMILYFEQAINQHDVYQLLFYHERLMRQLQTKVKIFKS